jgi:hypothetical protein
MDYDIIELTSFWYFYGSFSLDRTFFTRVSAVSYLYFEGDKAERIDVQLPSFYGEMACLR